MKDGAKKENNSGMFGDLISRLRKKDDKKEVESEPIEKTDSQPIFEKELSAPTKAGK